MTFAIACAGARPGRRCRVAPSPARGFTLVELLVVIAIIGILVALLLPAVQAARESARRSKCTNNLKNLTLGMINHESTHSQLPASGWSGHWTGDPDRGSGEEQPGGWLYCILPFIEETALHDMGLGETGQARIALLQERDATPLAVMNCPSRRNGGPYTATHPGGARSGDGTGAATWYPQPIGARGDYAVSVGDETDYDGFCLGVSPDSYGLSLSDFPPHSSIYSGISFCGSAVPLRQIVDGTSKTIALGERWVPQEVYSDASQTWAADDWAMYVGFQDDTVRSTFYNGRTPSHTPRSDTTSLTELEDEIGQATRELFGGPHTGGCLFSMCDGSVSTVNYDVDPEVFRQMGDRRDEGQVKEFSRRN